MSRRRLPRSGSWRCSHQPLALSPFSSLRLDCTAWSPTRSRSGARRSGFGWHSALSQGSVVLNMLRRVAMPVALGACAGLVASLWLTQFVAPLLYGVEPRDPVTLFAATLTLATAGLIAAWIPASRAARLDPASALREQ